MRDVTYIKGKDHTYTVRMSPAFAVKFRDGVGGHTPVGADWVKGVPDHVAEYWQAHENPAASGFIIADPPPPPKPKAVPKAKPKPKPKAKASKK